MMAKFERIQFFLVSCSFSIKVGLEGQLFSRIITNSKILYKITFIAGLWLWWWRWWGFWFLPLQVQKRESRKIFSLLARLPLIYIVSFSGSQGNDPGSTSCRFEINQIFTQQPPAIRHVLNPWHLESNESGRATIDDFLIHLIQATLSPAQAARS